LGIDLFPREDINYNKMVGLDHLNDVLPEVDVVVLTLPLTEETRHLMDKDAFARLKEGVILVNIARGEIVDTEALISNIDKLGGAVLDVFEEEPLNESSPLWYEKNVIITPHNSFVGDGNQKRLDDLIMKNFKIRKRGSKNESSFDSDSAKSYLPIS